MNNKKKAITWVAVLVLLLGSSYFVYNHLGDTDSVVSNMLFSNTTDGEDERDTDEDLMVENEDVSIDEGEGVDSDRVEAIDFTLTDFDGNEVSLSDYRGKMVILNFWASWCPPCIAEMPDFDDANKELLEGDDAVILTVNLTNGYRGETEEAAREFINENGYTLPVLFDKEGAVAQRYNVRSIPTTYFIDKEGYVIQAFSGQISKNTILEAVERYK
ncbi:TlpA disulfide reductase family protein [Herbivorax sp. ANBcel31]|uniref:TlpA family protein disulfide reductase n=1 Tax=Herbivorax sp. ANBcel31 TaxID=3069754 RepID=UPI0027B3999F|nr:TlpA disulfide reductase family protein [Herbivorax sp. ANBcel31]MDQ2084954.1 TlpA disulfide reductase family protein [Herbivorax sp. ANBcel31]